MDQLKHQEIKEITCFKCSEPHLPNYGYHVGECDECFFSRFTKEQREKFYRSLFKCRVECTKEEYMEWLKEGERDR